MHKTASAAALTKLLNQFSVPMFAVERKDPRATFRFVCLNEAMAVTGGRSAARTIGKSTFDLMPTTEAEIVNARYLECAQTREVVRFQDGFTTLGRRVIWDTTLQFMELSDGAQRIVGTSIQLSQQDTVLPETVTYENINYISTMADYQLQNLVTLFETYRDRDLFQAEAAPRIDRLSGMCRSIQRAVSDIRKIAQGAQNQRQPIGDQLVSNSMNAVDSNFVCSGIVRALVACSTETQDTYNS